MRHPKRSVCLFSAALMLLWGCDEPAPLFTTSSSSSGPGTGGQAGNTTTTGGAGGTAGSGAGGATGGAFTSCEDCAPDKPICVDNMECASECPNGRDLCHPGGAPTSGVCCPAGEQCCEAAVFDYTGGDLCRPDGEACPIGCPDSDQACPFKSFCQPDPSSGTTQCTDNCPPNQICGFNVCCPTGTACVNGTCALPDLTIDAVQLAMSAHIEVANFAPDACEIFEGCVAAAGQRTLLRFDLRTPNIGAADLILGEPEGNPLFEFSMCHGHYHFTAYADYRLKDSAGNDVAFGHKQAFCLEDVAPNSDPPMGAPLYSCTYQGIQAGWADVYGSGLPCQWVDITDVPPGDYNLYAAVNFDHVLAESSYDNNIASVPFTVPPNTCPMGCTPTDAVCCKPDNPCGWANNGSCDCTNFFGWDNADCASCTAGDPSCLIPSSCPAGCSPNMGPCCADGDPCGLAGNYACDCGGAFSWDAVDCDTCSGAPPCPANSCPNGCTTAESSPQCCMDGNPCNWDGDGFCDCSGLYAWDSQDCGNCTSSSPNCP